LSPYACAIASLVPSGRGDWPVAEHHVAAAREAARRSGDRASLIYAAAAGVHLALCRGSFSDLVDAAEPLLLRTEGACGAPGLVLWQVPVLTGMVRLRRLDRAERLLHEAAERAEERGHASSLSGLARVSGELHAVRREMRDSRSCFERALQLTDGATNRLDRGLTHASFGAFLRRRGERRNAAAQLQLAISIFRELRAEPFLSRARDELAACGGRPSVPPSDGRMPPLTPQEFAVARLAVAGRRNREIADELVLSLKTVDFHLGHVYAKLRVRSRTELAARWSEATTSSTSSSE